MTDSIRPMRRWFYGLMAILILSMPWWLAWDADLRLAVYDPVESGFAARPGSPLLIHPHHPLHALLARGLAELLAPLDGAHAGQRAVRLLSALGLGLFLLAALRPIHRPIALLILLPWLCARGTLMEVLSGEVLPLALGLLACGLRAAQSDRPRSLGALIVMGTLWRQDFILWVPALLLAWPATFRQRARLLLIAGLTSFALYALLHRVAAPSESLWSWLTTLARAENVNWAPPRAPTLDDARLHLAALGAYATGYQSLDLQSQSPWLHAAIGLAFVSLPLLLLSRAPFRSTLLPVLLPSLALSFAFYSWFEPWNFEWWMISTGLLTFAALQTLHTPTKARPADRSVLPPSSTPRALAPGSSSTAPSLPSAHARAHPRWVAVLAIALSAAILSAHGPSTLALYDRTLAETTAAVSALVPIDQRTVVFVDSPRLAVLLRGDPRWSALRILPATPMAFAEAIAATPPGTSIALAFDRSILDGSPALLRRTEDHWSPWLDASPPLRLSPDERLHRDHTGRVTARWLLRP